MIAAIILILLLFFGSMAALRVLYNKNWSKGLSLKLDFADREVYEGEKTELVEELANRKNLPLPAVEIDFDLDRGLRFTNTANSIVSDKLYRRDVFAISARQKITRRLELNCTRRGYYRIEKNGISANDIFLSKKYVGSFPQNGELYVFPERISADRVSVPFNRIMGELLCRDKVYEDPLEFGGIRDYMSSDPMKYINWKASARSAELVVNLHDSTLSQRVCIFLDTADNYSAFEEELNEEAVRLVLALAERISSRGILLDVYGNAADKEEDEALRMENIGSASLRTFARALARLKFRDISIEKTMGNFTPDRKTLYILISKNQDLEALRELSRLGAISDALWICPYMNEKKPMEVPGNITCIPWAADVRKAEGAAI